MHSKLKVRLHVDHLPTRVAERDLLDVAIGVVSWQIELHARKDSLAETYQLRSLEVSYSYAESFVEEMLKIGANLPIELAR